MHSNLIPKFGIVIPTLGERIGYLSDLFRSLTSFTVDIQVIVVAPRLKFSAINAANDSNLSLILVEDPGAGLASAINTGFKLVRAQYWNWIGDDDLFDSSGIEAVIKCLDDSEGLTFGWGNCVYVNGRSEKIGLNKVGAFAAKMVYFGPNLIPQPSCVFRVRETFRVEALDPSLKFTFDQDLIMKLLKHKNYIHIPVVSSRYRWHRTTLTSSNRKASARESLGLRIKYSKENFGLLAFLNFFTFPIVKLTLFTSSLFFRQKSN
jgi:glycosyltransferase involved in cell wall biosynthesis